jgi:hypothetical protein
MIRFTPGQEINNCTFLKMVSSGQYGRMGLFECRCGNEFEDYLHRVKSSKTRNCGCIRRKQNGVSKHPLSNRYFDMLERCYNKNNPRYRSYGARGISVCQEWRDDPFKYYAHLESLPNYGKEGYTIDRIDNNGDYEPGNIRWADHHTQGANQRAFPGVTGYTGVWVHKKRFRATIKRQDKQTYIGLADTPKAAAHLRDLYIIKNGLWEYPIQVIKRVAV